MSFLLDFAILPCLKNKMKDCLIITLMIFILLFGIQLVNGMVLCKERTATLDYSVQKSLRYRHHKQNYIRSLDEGIIPTGLRINNN